MTTFGNGSVVTVLTYIAPILVKVTGFNERAVSQVLKGHTGQVGSVALGQLGGCEVVVSGSADKTVRVWEASTGESQTIPLAA
jgi:WD40 repeat protein